MDDARVELLDGDRVPAVVLDLHAELGSLDAEAGVFGDENRRFEVETGGEDAVVGGGRVEHPGEAVGGDAVDLDPQPAPGRQRDGFTQAAGLRGPERLQ